MREPNDVKMQTRIPESHGMNDVVMRTHRTHMNPGSHPGNAT